MFTVPAIGNFSEEVAYVKPQDTNSIDFTVQSDEVQSQMAKNNRGNNRNHPPQSEYISVQNLFNFYPFKLSGVGVRKVLYKFNPNISSTSISQLTSLFNAYIETHFHFTNHKCLLPYFPPILRTSRNIFAQKPFLPTSTL
jgi:hypothetical protein